MLTAEERATRAIDIAICIVLAIIFLILGAALEHNYPWLTSWLFYTVGGG